MTCGDGREWTCCRQMACKRSGVRISLALLVRSIIRTDRTGSTAAKYRNGGPVGHRTCVRIQHLWFRGLLADLRAPSGAVVHSVCELGKLPFSRGCDSCRLVSSRSFAGADVSGDCCRACRWSPRRRPKHPKIYCRHPHQPLGVRVRGSRPGVRIVAPGGACAALRRAAQALDCASAHASSGMNGGPGVSG